MKPRIGYVGLGAMGLPFASHLVEAGYTVTGLNRSERPYAAAKKAGLRIAASLKECVEQSDLLFTNLPSPEIVAQVYSQLDKPGLICVDNSTIGADLAKSLHVELEKRGMAFVECPLIGVAERAKIADVSLVMAGKKDHVETVRQVALFAARDAYYVGGPGAASIVKTVQNGLAFVQMAAIAEALSIVERAGIDVEAFIHVVSNADGLASSPMFKVKAPHMRNLPEQTGSTLGIASKDLNLSAALSGSLQLSTPVTSAAAKQFQQAVEMGYSEADFAAIIRVVQARSRQTDS